VQFAILALVLSWLPVALDCRGGPEAVSRYEVVTYEARYLGEIIGADGLPQPDYFRALNVYRVPQAISGPSGCGAYPCLALPDPVPLGIGDVTYLSDPVAIDYSDNRSDTPCGG